MLWVIVIFVVDGLLYYLVFNRPVFFACLQLFVVKFLSLVICCICCSLLMASGVDIWNFLSCWGRRSGVMGLGGGGGGVG